MQKSKIINDVEFKYEFFDNKSNKLAVIFQGMGQSNQLVDRMKKGEHKEEGWEETKERISNIYTFYKIFDEKEYNLLFLPDVYSEFVSWYVIDSGKDIRNEMTEFIDEIIIECGHSKENTLLFGQSKGGFASLIYGSRLKNVGYIASNLPIVSPGVRYVRNINNKNFSIQMDLLRGELSREELIKLLKKMTSEITIDPNKKYYSSIGISDEFTCEILDIYEGYEAKVYMNRTPNSHAGYAKISRAITEHIAKEVADEIDKLK